MRTIQIFLFIVLSNFVAIGQNKELHESIKKESIGGTLDFTNAAEKQASGKGLILYEGVAYNKKDFAILLWGVAVRASGINTIREACNLWEEINKRELTKTEKKALRTGFEAKLE